MWGVEEKGHHNIYPWAPFLKLCNLLLLPFPVRKDEAAIANHVHDHADHVSIRQQVQQLASEAAVPYSVVGWCEIDKHSSGLLFS